MNLAEAARGRDNNFHLIRFLAALAVLYGHCYPLTGSGQAAPLADWLGLDIGTLAVDVFFVTSGYLVTASLRHDIDGLSARFGVSFEQACHRLSTLQRREDLPAPLQTPIKRIVLAGRSSYFCPTCQK